MWTGLGNPDHRCFSLIRFTLSMFKCEFLKFIAHDQWPTISARVNFLVLNHLSV